MDLQIREDVRQRLSVYLGIDDRDEADKLTNEVIIGIGANPDDDVIVENVQDIETKEEARYEAGYSGGFREGLGRALEIVRAQSPVDFGVVSILQSEIVKSLGE